MSLLFRTEDPFEHDTDPRLENARFEGPIAFKLTPGRMDPGSHRSPRPVASLHPGVPMSLLCFRKNLI